MKSNYAEHALIGMGIGFPITLVCMTLIGGFNAIVAEFLVWMIASALYGILSGIVFIKKKDLSLPAAMGIHCLGCLLITVIAATVCGYADSFLSLLMGILPVFFIVYALVYALCVILMKKNEKQINDALNKK